MGEGRRFKKGDPRPKGAGRKKGQLSKRSVFLQDALTAIKWNLLEDVKAAYEKLDNDKKVEYGLKLMEFVYPKRTAVDMNITGDLKIDSFTEAISDVNKLITTETIEVQARSIPEATHDESGTH